MCHQPIRFLAELSDQLPVRLRVQDDANPASMADVRWPEVALGIAPQQRLLCAEGCWEPHRQMRGAVVVIIEHGERLPLAGEPRRLAMGDLLDSIRQSHADRTQPCERICTALSALRVSDPRLS